MVEQVLDSMDIERERGITIKAQTVRLDYKAQDGKTYILNLMDTPGHVDFAYEVSRSLAACEGSLLVVDASQGVEAQTLANVYQAHRRQPRDRAGPQQDRPAGRRARARQGADRGGDRHRRLRRRADLGQDRPRHRRSCWRRSSQRLPPPKGDATAPLKALLVDSWYDAYLGVVVLVRVIDGVLKKGQTITHDGHRRRLRGRPHRRLHARRCTDVDELGPGEVGFITALDQGGGRHPRRRHHHRRRASPRRTALPGFKPAQPVVFCGLFPVDAAEFEDLRAAMGKLRLNDASFSYEMETSAALGFGFRCGFLGLLHLEIIQERLEREFNLDLIATAPSVIYQHQPARRRRRSSCTTRPTCRTSMKIAAIEEPWIRATILTPGRISRRRSSSSARTGAASQVDLNYVGKRAMVVYDLPLNEVVFDFYDRLKSISKGYASFDYHLTDYREGDLVKMSILVNAEPVDALSMLVHRARAEMRGRAMCEKLKELIPPHMFQIPIQAAIGGKIIARETIRALRKDVTAKCYGGDVTRKRKLLDKQKEGKKRMRQFGKVEIPQEAFIAALKMDS